MNKELILKAKEAKSAEELLALARENNIELTKEQAKECYERLKGADELSDDELESIAGGGGHFKDAVMGNSDSLAPPVGCL